MSVLAQSQQAAPSNGLAPYAGTSPINPALIPLVAGVAVGIVVILILLTSRYSDQHTRGFLTISLLIVFAFILAAFASMVYSVPTNPATEILVGSLSTALGAIVAHWVGRSPPAPAEQQHTDGAMPRDEPR